MAFVTLIAVWMVSRHAPWKGENLQYLPKDISREALTQRMREFSFVLVVRCHYCHAGGNGIRFERVSRQFRADARLFGAERGDWIDRRRPPDRQRARGEGDGGDERG